MQGSGRRGNLSGALEGRRRRKKQQQVLNAFPEPDTTREEYVMRVVGIRGGNLYDLECDGHFDGVYRLPNRLRHVVWIRPGSVVIARLDEDEEDDNQDGGVSRSKSVVRGEILHVLMQEQVKHLQRQGFWPEAWVDVEERTDRDTDKQPSDSSQSEIERNGNVRRFEEEWTEESDSESESEPEREPPLPCESPSQREL